MDGSVHFNLKANLPHWTSSTYLKILPPKKMALEGLWDWSPTTSMPPAVTRNPFLPKSDISVFVVQSK